MSSNEPERFTWHPTYRGQAVTAVRQKLERDLASDQRAHNLMMEGAEDHEGQVLASVIALDKRWSPFDFGWAEADPKELVERILAYELAVETRREVFSYAEFREQEQPLPSAARGETAPWWAFWRR